MKIVIDIDEKLIEDAKNGIRHLDEIADAVIKNGIPLPNSERPTGKWVFEGCEWRCTICGETPWYFNRTPVESGYKFCPYCGARMEAENE